METNFTPKNAEFYCKNCAFICIKKSDWNRHIQTVKHLYRNTGNKMETKKTPNTPTKTLCSCICGKEYTSRAGLWKHKNKCKIEENFLYNNNNNNNNIEVTKINKDSKTNEVEELKEFMKYLMKENSEMKNMIIEVIKNGTHNTINNTTHNTNSNNKSFNLQFFLNETCKDAMNIMDFVDSIKLQLSDLERVGELGYVEGISNIIVKNLNALDVTQRPVHCTDKKREVLYVKDENKWEKDDDNRAKMHKVVRKVADKNAKLLPRFKEEYPDCSKSTSKYSDQYNKIIIESMGGAGDNDFEKEEKIIKKISKEVFIDKEPSEPL
jgi:hypothetical protein